MMMMMMMMMMMRSKSMGRMDKQVKREKLMSQRLARWIVTKISPRVESTISNWG